MWSRRSRLREYLQGALWVLPSVAVVVGLGSGALLAALPIGPHSPLNRFLFQGTADDARQLLIVVSATMITVTGVVFSMTVVSLQIASSQFSVRLLRTFMRDVPNQVVLAIFICTFSYSTGGLYTVGRRAAGDPFVPRVAVSGSLWLAFASTAALVYFLHHLVHSIQVDTIMERVQSATLSLIDEVFPQPDEPGGDHRQETTRPEGPDPPHTPGRAGQLTAPSSGYVQAVDIDALVRLAAGAGIAIRFTISVGDYVIRGASIGVWWRTAAAPEPAAGPGSDPVPGVLREVQVGFERTLQQDIRFGLRQLVDIALRALSPAINDPYTAVQVVHHLSAIEAVLAGRAIGDDVRAAADGAWSVRLPYPGFATYLEIGCAQIRRCGAREPLVLAALLQMLSEVAARCTDPDRRAAVLAQIELIASDAEREVPQATDRQLVTDAARLAAQVARVPGAAAPPPSAFGMVAAAAGHARDDGGHERPPATS